MYRLSKDVQVRKENWGLLFYSQGQHRVSFVRSRDWLEPRHFDGTWSTHRLVGDITDRTGKSSTAVASSVKKIDESLLKSGMITDELR